MALHAAGHRKPGVRSYKRQQGRCVAWQRRRHDRRQRRSFRLRQSSLAAAGWTYVVVDSAASITAFFNGTGSTTVASAGLIMLDSGSVNVTGGLAADEDAVLTSNAAKINSFLGTGGALFSQANTNGFLSTLVPGLSIVASSQTGINLTAAGSAAFSGLSNADLSSGPYHVKFTNVGSIPVLGVGTGSFRQRQHHHWRVCRQHYRSRKLYPGTCVHAAFHGGPCRHRAGPSQGLTERHAPGCGRSRAAVASKRPCFCHVRSDHQKNAAAVTAGAIAGHRLQPDSIATETLGIITSFGAISAGGAM